MKSRAQNDVEEFLFGEDDTVSRRNLVLVGGEELIDHNERRKPSGFYSLIYSILRFVQLSMWTIGLEVVVVSTGHIPHTTGVFLR